MQPQIRSGRRSTFVYLILLAGALLCAGSAGAQYGDTWQGHLAGSYNMVQGKADDAVNDGWGLTGGATYRPGDGPLGILTELSYHDFDIDNEVARLLGASDGSVEIWSLTVGPSWQFEGSGNVGFQISTGVGIYDLTGKLTNPGLVVVPICDPWFWWCYPGIVPGDIIVDRESTTRFGWNIGVGVTFDAPTGGQWFLEARYHRAETKTATEFIPVSVGYRW